MRLDNWETSVNLIPLEDDLNFFPPYFAAPVLRLDTLSRYPEIRLALDRLGCLLDDATMQELNYSVDEDKKTPREVAREFLLKQGIIVK